MLVASAPRQAEPLSVLVRVATHSTHALSQCQGCGEGRALLPDASGKAGIRGNGIGH